MRKDFYDSLEVDNPELREGGLFGRLPNLIALAPERRRLGAPARRRRSQHGDLARGACRMCRCCGPATGRRCAATTIRRSAASSFSQRGRTRRVLMSPGPVFHPDIERKDWWGAARALFAAGMRPGDVVLNCFSYHLSPFGFLMDSGAQALGCHRHRRRIGRRHRGRRRDAHAGAARLCRFARIPQAADRCVGRPRRNGDHQARAGRRRAAHGRAAPRVRVGGHRGAGMPGASRRRHHRL